MLDLSLEEVLKVAEEMGIEYELESDSPGFYISDEDGSLHEVSLEELLLIDEDMNSLEEEIDMSISNALNNSKKTKTKKINLGDKYEKFIELDEVA